MELNVMYAMVNERLRQQSPIEVIDARLDMRPGQKAMDSRRARKTGK